MLVGTERLLLEGISVSAAQSFLRISLVFDIWYLLTSIVVVTSSNSRYRYGVFILPRCAPHFHRRTLRLRRFTNCRYSLFSLVCPPLWFPSYGSMQILPNRPSQHSHFKLDLRNFPWRDGRGNQEPYATAVRRWCCSHDVVPISTQTIFLWTFTVWPCTLSSTIDLLNFAAWYRMSPFYLMTGSMPWSTVDIWVMRSQSSKVYNEQFQYFAVPLHALVSRYSAHGIFVILHESIIAILLLAKCSV